MNEEEEVVQRLQFEFQAAMDRYHGNFFYRRIGLVVSTLIVSLQAVALTQIEWAEVGPAYIVYFIAAYIAADFVNGAIHMWMDNNGDYTSLVGPLIAAFHLHHKRPRYAARSTVVTYFLESGMKNWLALYMAIVVYAQTAAIPDGLSFSLVAFGILSSVAELAHYWCHSPPNVLVRTLQRSGLLLRPKRHAVHHTSDNKNYAFLNGMTDPVLNAIAKRTCNGYKKRADLHSLNYVERKKVNE